MLPCGCNSRPSSENVSNQFLTTFDRVFWMTLRRLWSGWRRPLLYVRPDTVARWQRERFRRFWARLSKRHGRRRGRPATAVEIRRLIERMVVANPLWRAPRIHGELKMLGIAISERTVSRILRGIVIESSFLRRDYARHAYARCGGSSNRRNHCTTSTDRSVVRAIHPSLQRQRGVVKSLGACLPAQYFQYRARPYCIDTPQRTKHSLDTPHSMLGISS